MIRDSLDLMKPHEQFTATATYYKDRPDSPDIGGQEFHYEYVNPYSKTYQRIFANIKGDAGSVAIRTNDYIPYKINGIVVTQDGKAFRIQQVERDFSDTPKQVLRLLSVPVSGYYLIRMIEIDEPWGIS